MCQTIILLTAQANEAKNAGNMAEYKENMRQIGLIRDSLANSKKSNVEQSKIKTQKHKR